MCKAGLQVVARMEARKGAKAVFHGFPLVSLLSGAGGKRTFDSPPQRFLLCQTFDALRTYAGDSKPTVSDAIRRLEGHFSSLHFDLRLYVLF